MCSIENVRVVSCELWWMNLSPNHSQFEPYVCYLCVKGMMYASKIQKEPNGSILIDIGMGWFGPNPENRHVYVRDATMLHMSWSYHLICWIDGLQILSFFKDETQSSIVFLRFQALIQSLNTLWFLYVIMSGPLRPITIITSYVNIRVRPMNYWL